MFKTRKVTKKQTYEFRKVVKMPSFLATIFHLCKISYLKLLGLIDSIHLKVLFVSQRSSTLRGKRGGSGKSFMSTIKLEKFWLLLHLAFQCYGTTEARPSLFHLHTPKSTPAREDSYVWCWVPSNTASESLNSSTVKHVMRELSYVEIKVVLVSNFSWKHWNPPNTVLHSKTRWFLESRLFTAAGCLAFVCHRMKP